MKTIYDLNLIDDFLFTEASIDSYQALTDIKLLDSGTEYDKLPDMWTIWILPYDPFGFDYMLYSVKNSVVNSSNIEYNDGVHKIFLYTKGTKGGSEDLKNLLNYIQISTAENAVDHDLSSLHNNVMRLKDRREMGVKYMQMAELIKYAAEEAAEEATKKETLRMIDLFQTLLVTKDIEELKLMADDTNFMNFFLDKSNVSD